MDFLNETAYRIIDTLTRDLGRTYSINELTGNIRRLHKIAHYKNVYDRIQDLEKKGYIKTTKIGKASAIRLNFNNHQLTDRLAEIELKKKQNLLEKIPEIQAILEETDIIFRKTQPQIKSISIVQAQKNIRLNRMELLITTENEKQRTQSIEKQVLELEKRHNMRIDPLIINNKDYLKILTSENANPPKEMLADQITFYNPQAYWANMRIAIKDGGKIKLREQETNPAKITEKDLNYNLSRFGYSEMEATARKGRKICPEYIITSILLKNDARKTQNIPTILAKNRIDYNILLFLAKKYNQEERILGLLEALNRIKPSEDSRQANETLKTLGIKSKKANIKTIRQNMRVYNAI